MQSLTFKQKVNLIKRLANEGYGTEKSLNSLEIEKMLNIPNITINDIHNIVELKRAVKAGKLLSYLTEKKDNETEVSESE